MFNFGGRGTTPHIQQYAAAVEQILLGIGIDPAQARMSTADGYGWSFRRGSAVIEVYIALRDDVGYLQVLAPILHLPAAGLLPLYRHLLELNLQLTNASIGVYLDVVYLFSERPLEGMDSVEANDVINLVAAYADELDDQIAGEFGGRLYARI